MMFRGVAAIHVLAVIVLAHAKEEAVNHMLFNRWIQGAPPPRHADMDNTVVGKTGHVANPASGISRPVHSLPKAPIGTSSYRAPMPMVGKYVSPASPSFGISRLAPIYSMPPGGQPARKTVPRDSKETNPDKLAQNEAYDKLEDIASGLNKAKVEETTPAKMDPYEIKCMVRGDEDGPVNQEWMKEKIGAALGNYHEGILSVDCRLNVEGHVRKARSYRMEVTVKTKHNTVVVSNPALAESSFTEAVDHIHDTLKSRMVKEKEKFISKKQHDREMAANVMDKPEDLEQDDEVDPVRATP